MGVLSASDAAALLPGQAVEVGVGRWGGRPGGKKCEEDKKFEFEAADFCEELHSLRQMLPGLARQVGCGRQGGKGKGGGRVLWIETQMEHTEDHEAGFGARSVPYADMLICLGPAFTPRTRAMQVSVPA